MFTLFAFIAVTMAAEYVQIEYNKGSYEISEFNKCYCYKDDKCYMYEKSADNKKILEYVYANAQNCDGTKPTPEEYTIGEKKDGFTYKLVDKLPEHKFHYFESEKTDCTDKDTRAKVLVTEDNCELDFYSGNLYNKYTLNENKVKMAEFTDSNCQTATKVDGTEEIKSQFDVNTCTQIEGEGDYGKFIPGTYAPKKQYVSIEYNSGSYEISELGKCYCYKDDYCYFYEINALGTKIVEKVYPADSNCQGTPESYEYQFDEVVDGLKYTIITELPDHKLHYFESMATDCSDKDSRAKVLLAENNCELDFYSGYLYNKYTLDGDKVKMAEYLDDQCTQISLMEGTEQIASEVNVNECVSIEGENGAKGKFGAGIYTSHEFVSIEYNRGSYEISEIKKCYCYKDNNCYMYEKNTDGSKVLEYVFENAQNCDGTKPTPNEYELNTVIDGMKYTIITQLPEHKFHYFESDNDDCTDKDTRAKVLVAEDNCELDFYSGDLWNKYTIDGNTVKMAEFTDAACTKQSNTAMASQIDANQCVPIEGEDDAKGKFIPGTYTPASPASEYFTVTYNKGVTELYEFGKCYCFPDDGCYKYEKVTGDNTKVNEFYYEGANDCSATPVPTPTPLTLNAEPDEKDVTYKIETTIPTHQFHYFASKSGNCDDSANMPVGLYTDDNCERDYYDTDDDKIYRTYRVTGTAPNQKIDIEQFTDKNCKISRKQQIRTEYQADTCVELPGEGHSKFITQQYAGTVPTGGYLGITYNHGVTELYKFETCYCFSATECYKYTMHATEETKVVEKLYGSLEDCSGTTATPTETTYTLNAEPTAKDLTFTIITQIPTHAFHYFASPAGDCSDSANMPAALYTEDNCERDFYSTEVIYRTYTVVEEGTSKIIDVKEYRDKECTKPRFVQTSKQMVSQYTADQCLDLDGGRIQFSSNEYSNKEYFYINYNIAAAELYEFTKCYCFPDDGCYKYEKVTGDTMKVNKYYYEGANDCSATPAPQPTQLTNFGEPDEKDISFGIFSSIPNYAFHYFASKTGDCTDSADVPLRIFMDYNCERDPHSKKVIYRQYTLTGTAPNQKIDIKQYKDQFCSIPMNKPTDVQKVTEHDINTCIDLNGKTSQFSAEKYQLAAAEGTPASEYLGITYNKDSIELYEFSKCYCFAEDSCYKYVKNADNVHVDEYTYPLDSKCEVATEPEPTQYKLDGTTVYDKDMTFKAYTYAQIPAHTFHYIVSATGDCEDVMPVPVEVFTATNCERDFYDEEDDKVYRKYTLSGTAPNQKIDIAQFSDNTCATTKKEQVPKVTEYEADKCLDVDGGKVQFSSAKYTLPTPPSPPQNNGSAFTMLLVALMVVFFLF